jgi:hypothetical protein
VAARGKGGYTFGVEAGENKHDIQLFEHIDGCA